MNEIKASFTIYQFRRLINYELPYTIQLNLFRNKLINLKWRMYLTHMEIFKRVS
jgi:hypothetical protein